MQTETIIEAVVVLKNAEISEEERLAIVKAIGTMQSPVLLAMEDLKREFKSFRRQMYWLFGALALAVLSLPDQALLQLLKAVFK